MTNFLEVEGVEKANVVDLDTYTLIGVDVERGIYFFKIREAKRK